MCSSSGPITVRLDRCWACLELGTLRMYLESERLWKLAKVCWMVVDEAGIGLCDDHLAEARSWE